MTVALLEPVHRAIAITGSRRPYVLGTGDYHPHPGKDGEVVDLPWTERDGVLGSDCAGFAISWCHRIRRHEPGANRALWRHPVTGKMMAPTVVDDWNTDSAVEDALGDRQRFEPVIVPALGLHGSVLSGDLLVYKTIHATVDGAPHAWIGHVALVLYPLPHFDPANPDWAALWIAQCCGPNGRSPAVIESDGHVFNHHDHNWGARIERRCVILRVKPH
jgi:hypothetical protein